MFPNLTKTLMLAFSQTLLKEDLQTLQCIPLWSYHVDDLDPFLKVTGVSETNCHCFSVVVVVFYTCPM